MRILSKMAVSAVIVVLGMFRAEMANAAACENLKSATFPDATITSAQVVAAGQFVPPAADDSGSYKDLPAFCRVAATLKPSADSDIKIEVWLPAANWNGKFQAVGNGGWAGVISYSALADAVRQGYATSSTDTGHVGARGIFAFGHPEKLIDFGHRAVHEMTVKAKTIIAAYYDQGPRYSYWNGCSTGGRQGLMEAQRFPDDYDGIIAGDPANPRTDLASWQLMVSTAFLADKKSNVAKEKYPAIHQAVLAACDAIDGLKDGLIDDPRQCKFDPNVLLCKGEETAQCLTAPQVAAARTITSPLKNSRTGKVVYPGIEHGAELGWATLAGGPEPNPIGIDQFRYVTFKDPNWDWRSFDFDRDVEVADKVDGGTINVRNPDLTAFQQRGGKLLTYHGWADNQVPPQSLINYYNAVLEKTGGAETASGWMRLFMVPGMGHCRGGEGPNTFDAVNALERWVEKNEAPVKIVASHVTAGRVDRTRPLCPYPQVARYQGTGSIDDAANFTCRMP